MCTCTNVYSLKLFIELYVNDTIMFAFCFTNYQCFNVIVTKLCLTLNPLDCICTDLRYLSISAPLHCQFVKCGFKNTKQYNTKCTLDYSFRQILLQTVEHTANEIFFNYALKHPVRQENTLCSGFYPLCHHSTVCNEEYL